jgi:hypothetical protein
MTKIKLKKRKKIFCPKCSKIYDSAKDNLIEWTANADTIEVAKWFSSLNDSERLEVEKFYADLEYIAEVNKAADALEKLLRKYRKDE